MKVTRSNKNAHLKDECQTPPYALLPLIEYIPENCLVWEPCSGDGLLEAGVASVLGNPVIGTSSDFFTTNVDHDIQITNPPFSKKYKWMERCFDIGKPFALLMPVDVIAAVSAHVLWKRYGINIILLSKRINFKMPIAGWSGSGSDFSVEWFTWKLGIKDSLVYYDLPSAKSLPKWMVKPDNKEEVLGNNYETISV